MEEKRTRGRPKGFSPGKRYTQLRQIMLSSDMDGALRSRAKVKGLTVSQIIRNAVARDLKSG